MQQFAVKFSMPCIVSLKLQREILLHRFLQTLPPYKAILPQLSLRSHPSPLFQDKKELNLIKLEACFTQPMFS